MSETTDPTTTPGAPGTPGTAQPASGERARKARGALTRYRVMAWVTGSMLLLLCAEMLLKYVFHAGGVDAQGHPEPVIGSWVAYAHGWIYVVYLATVADLWSKMRWSLGRLVAMAAAGVVPVMSFVLERRVHRDAEERIAGLA